VANSRLSGRQWMTLFGVFMHRGTANAIVRKVSKDAPRLHWLAAVVGGRWEGERSGPRRRPCTLRSRPSWVLRNRPGIRVAWSGRSARSSRRRSGRSGSGFSLRAGSATSPCSTWRSTASCGCDQRREAV